MFTYYTYATVEIHYFAIQHFALKQTNVGLSSKLHAFSSDYGRLGICGLAN